MGGARGLVAAQRGAGGAGEGGAARGVHAAGLLHGVVGGYIITTSMEKFILTSYMVLHHTLYVLSE